LLNINLIIYFSVKFTKSELNVILFNLIYVYNLIYKKKMKNTIFLMLNTL